MTITAVAASKQKLKYIQLIFVRPEGAASSSNLIFIV